MSLLRFGSVGSLGFCCRMLFLWVIKSLMFWGRSLCLLCCLPLEMWCLSAVSMMFVSMVFAWWGFRGISMFVSASYIFCVKSSQRTLW